MILVDYSKFSHKLVRLKSVTTSLGGSISYVSPDSCDETSLIRQTVPLSVVRDFIVSNGSITKYLIPVLTSLVSYDGIIVSMERHPLGSFGSIEESANGEIKQWVPKSVTNLTDFVIPLLTQSTYDWYIDGRYMYCFGVDVDQLFGKVSHCVPLSSDEKFRSVPVDSIDLQKLHYSSLDSIRTSRCTIGYLINGIAVVTPPLWQSTSSIRGSSLADYDNHDDDDGDQTSDPVDTMPRFDQIDTHLSVNLAFVLMCGKIIGKLFGYDAVDPLQLPRLMVEMSTTNLPNVSKSIKQTYCCGTPFTHLLAWVMGIMHRNCTSLESLIELKQVIKYLTSRGLFHKSSLSTTSIFIPGKTIDDVELVQPEALL